MKRTISKETYSKMNKPDLGSKIYLLKNGKKVFGIVSYIEFTGDKSKHKGGIRIGIIPFHY